MPKTNYDVIINGVKARILQEAEGGGGYKRRTVRREIQNQIVAQSENPTLRNRDDGIAFYQTSWAGGARWWKPLITPTDLSSYYRSNNLDVWSEPGKIVPLNDQVVETSSSANLHDAMVGAGEKTGVQLMIGNTELHAGGFLDVYEWDVVNGDWDRITNINSGIDTSPLTFEPQAMVYNPNDNFYYVLSQGPSAAGHITRFNLDTLVVNTAWIAGFSTYTGANIFLQNNNLMLWNGEKLHTIDTSGASLTVVFEDGLGPDILGEDDITSPLARPTPEGVYYVKTIAEGSQYHARVFRVDRDQSGQWIGVPIATMPIGFLALGLLPHMGQILISGTPNVEDIGNLGSTTEIYFVGEGGMGSLGAILGNRDEVDELPFRFLGATGPVVWMAGSKRLWAYDAIRGGLHSVWEWPTAGMDHLDNFLMFRAFIVGSGSGQHFVYTGTTVTKVDGGDSPDTVVAFGDDEDHYTLESNFFDGNVPMEEKVITRVAIFRDKDDGGSEWTVQISADDAAFVDVLEDSGTSVFAEADVSGITGYQFRYKVIYQTKDTERSALRAILVEMTTGDMVTEWDLILDGSQLRNMENKIQNPKTFADNMVLLGDNNDIITLIDNYQEHSRSESTGATGTSVKVMAVEVMKDTPGESAVRVLLRET